MPEIVKEELKQKVVFKYGPRGVRPFRPFIAVIFLHLWLKLHRKVIHVDVWKA